MKIAQETEEKYLNFIEKEYGVRRITYREPPKIFYDPFEVFKPSKGFIKEVIKQLRRHPYAQAGTKLEALKKEWGGELPDSIQKRRDEILSRINQYDYRLRNWGQHTDSESKITDSKINQAKSVPIIELYRGRLRGNSQGKHNTGKCPFHSERTGSFTIYQKTNSWYCFGACATGGTVIDFIMKRDNIDFIEAVKYLNNI